MKEQWVETGMGLGVIVIAGWFLAYSLSAGGGGGKPGGYPINARFGQVGSLMPGAPVTVAGVKVGTVSSIRLDTTTYLAQTTLTMNADVQLPADSTAKITSDGLLGSVHVAIAPGGATETLRPGGQITNTQGAIDMFDLIGAVIRPQASPTTEPNAINPAASSGETP